MGLEQKLRSRERAKGSKMGKTGAGEWASDNTAEKDGPDGNMMGANLEVVCKRVLHLSFSLLESELYTFHDLSYTI